MKVVVKFNSPEGYSSFISLDENELWVEEKGEKLLIKSSYENRFNALISLFAMKNEWVETDDLNGLYTVAFENKEEIKCYSFNETPDNWNMFMGYLARLVGDSL